MALGLAVSGVASAAVWQSGDLTNELVVAEGETYTLTASDAARLGTTCLHLTGEGTVVGTEAFAAFMGSIRISNGTFQHKEAGGLGSTDAAHTGSLVIDGGTLESYVEGYNTWSSRDLPTVPVGLTVYLSGTGYQGKGAIDVRKETQNFARTVVLAGDTLITSPWQQALQLRYCNLSQSVPAPKVVTKNVKFGLVQQWPESSDGSGWEITVSENGIFDLSDSVLPFHDSTVRLTDTSCMRLYNFGGDANKVGAASPFETDYYASLIFSDSASVFVNAGCPLVDEKGASLKDEKNRFAGSVTLEGSHVVSFASKDPEKAKGVAFDGVVSGAGGFAAAEPSAAAPGWLRLSNRENSFAGGVSVRGAAKEDGTFEGGLSLLANGAAPADGGAITLANATLRLNNSIHGEQTYELPEILVEEGGEIVDNLSVRQSITAKGLTKTGEGTCILSAPMTFSGLADIQKGTLKLVASNKAQRGLKMWWRKADANKDADIQQDDYYQGLDGDVSWAYQPWTDYGDPATHDGSHNQGYYYEGFIRIPGDEGADVTFNFISCLARACDVWIDGTLVSSMNDNVNNLANAGGVYVGGWSRIGISPRFTMKAGWHTLAIVMRNWYDGSCGPLAGKVDGKELWPANFALGVDWQGRCTTNTADYVKLQDSGDGSFLRWTDDPVVTQAHFDGGVAFAAGTVFDLGGTADEKNPLVVASLTGAPIIRNGALQVSSNEWNLRVGDVVPGLPLTVEAGSSLGFGEKGSTVTVSVAAEALDGLRGANSKVKILDWASAAERPDNKFVASAGLKTLRWTIQTRDDGIYLERSSFMIILR